MRENIYDPKLVGAHIAVGGEHKVYRYGDDQVIKFPFGPRYWFDPKKYCENLKRDESIARQYFGGYLVDREIRYFEENRKPSYVILEPFLLGRHLRRADLDDSGVKHQFEELIAINKRFTKTEQLSVEFFGIRGLLIHGKKEAANLIYNPDTKKITLTDAGVMHLGDRSEKNILIRLVTNWAIKKQAKLIDYYLSYPS